MTLVQTLSADVLAKRPLPDPNEASDKNSRGRVLAVAGSAAVPGAALLAGIAALRAGAGKIQLGVPRSIGAALGIAFPECGILSLKETDDGQPLPNPVDLFSAAIHKADAVLIGPGLMDAEGATNLVKQALAAKTDGTFVLDALALCDIQNYRDTIKQHRGNIVLTPHHGEMAALLGIEKDEVGRDPLRFARTTAENLDCCVILKSDITYIACPDGDTWEHKGGVIGLATAGSGDVLAGIVTGLLARGADPATASLWAVYVHAAAGRALTGRIAPVGFLARDILDLIPGLIRAA
jgi:ADP-dependent NAD(P)H-hydrate dehydratase